MSAKTKKAATIPHNYVPWGFPEELALCEACKVGNINEVNKLIANKVNLNFVDGFGKTPLHYACQEGNYEVVKLLVANKASVNVFDANGTTPLHLATKGDFVRIVKFLLMVQADFNKECLSGCKPIDLAMHGSETWDVLYNANRGSLPVIDHLLQTVSIVPKFAVEREIQKQAAAKNKQKGKDKKKKK